MKMTRFVGALAALMVCAGCGITVDLSNLSFQPADAVTATPDNSVEPDLVGGKDERQPEDTEPVEDIAAPPAIGCWEALECVLTDEECKDLSQDDCVRNCAEDEDWKLNNPALDKLQACVYNKCSGDPRYPLPDDYFMCFAEQCAQELVECIRLPEGDQSCGEVLGCASDHGCFEEDAAPELGCLATCFQNMDVDAKDQIEELFEQCVPNEANPQGGDSFDCIATMLECYAGNGDADCAETLECLGKCSEDAGADDEDSCEAGCFLQMTEEAADSVSGMFACQVDEMSNPFDCAIASMPCLTAPDVQVACNSITGGGMTTIFAAYYFHKFPNNGFVKAFANHLLANVGLDPEDVGPLEQFGFMMWGVASVVEEQHDELEDVLQCLSDSQSEGSDIHPGDNAYGQVKIPDWEKCVNDTVCNHPTD